MPSNIHIGRRYWNQEYSNARTHSGSADVNLGGDPFHTYEAGDGSWTPPLSYHNGVDIIKLFDQLNGTGTISEYSPESVQGLVIRNEESFGEVYTEPYTGFGSIICEATPRSMWEFAITAKNVTGDPTIPGGTVTLWIFALDETGVSVGPYGAASGSEGGPAAIPTDKGAYYITQTLPATAETFKLRGIGQFVNNARVRYISIRIDVDDPMAVRFIDLYLQPRNLKRSDQPLIWNSPRLYKFPLNLTWGSGSQEQNDIGNGVPHEYLRLSFGDHPDDTPLTTYLEDKGLRGWRYGSDGATGGTTFPFPAGPTSTGNYNSSDINYDGGSGPTYGHWNLRSGLTPSAENNPSTGPANGPMTLPDFEFYGSYYRHHFGWKRSLEPPGYTAANHLASKYHNYLYVETSSGRKERNILRLPRINFKQTHREETLSFYLHSFGANMGQLTFYYQTNASAFFLPDDGTPPSTVTNVPGLGVAAQITSSIFQYSPYGIQGWTGPLDYINATYNDWGTLNQQSIYDSWHRVEVDLTRLRGLDVYILIMYAGASGWKGDIAISNLRVAGIKNTSVPQVLGCMNPNALNFNPLATEDDGTCAFPEIDVPAEA